MAYFLVSFSLRSCLWTSCLLLPIPCTFPSHISFPYTKEAHSPLLIPSQFSNCIQHDFIAQLLGLALWQEKPKLLLLMITLNTLREYPKHFDFNSNLNFFYFCTTPQFQVWKKIELPILWLNISLLSIFKVSPFRFPCHTWKPFQFHIKLHFSDLCCYKIKQIANILNVFQFFKWLQQFIIFVEGYNHVNINVIFWLSSKIFETFWLILMYFKVQFGNFYIRNRVTKNACSTLTYTVKIFCDIIFNSPHTFWQIYFAA